MGKPEELEEAFIQGINKSLGINKFAEEIYKAFPAIPKEQLLSLTRDFIKGLKHLEKIYEGHIKNGIFDDIDKHIPHAD